MGQFSLNREAVMEFITDRYAPRVAAAGEIVAQRMRDLTDTACPEYNTGKGGHSAPGSPPYLESGELNQGIQSIPIPNGLMASMGTDSIHGVWMELGTTRVLPRPWAMRSLLESRDAIMDVICDGDTRRA